MLKLPFTSSTPDNLLRGTDGSAGLDIRSPETFTLHAGEKYVLDTGVRINAESLLSQMPRELSEHMGVFCALYPRSSLGFQGLQIANTTPIIDCDYQGSLVIHLVLAAGRDPLTIEMGDRIVQCVVTPYFKVTPVQVNYEDLFETESTRGMGGLGSTGKG